MSADRVYFIAEAGVNHNGSLPLALDMIDVAADAGADAVKFQSAIPEEVVSVHAPKARYQIASTGDAGSQLDMVRKLHFGANRTEAHRELAARAAKRNIDLLSTPFDVESLHFLIDDIGLRTIKIASGDLTYSPLLLAAARANCNIILSTGMATLEEIEAALGVIAFGYLNTGNTVGSNGFRAAYSDQRGRTVLRQRVTLLHCVTAYPAPIEQTNLRAMDTLAQSFGMRAGFSDHSLGTTMAIAAVARGAAIVEKHFSLDRSLPGPDHAASLEPKELTALIADIRALERGLGTGVKEPQSCELENIDVARRSLVARRAIRRGEEFSEENLAAKRPTGGVSPMRYWDLIGTDASRDYGTDEAISDLTSNDRS